MNANDSVGRRVGTYLALTFGFSSIFYFLIIRARLVRRQGGGLAPSLQEAR